MGIKGLTTYMNPMKNHFINDASIKIQDLAKTARASETKRARLVIDGNSLIYHIIVEYKLDICIARCGGTYWQFERVTFFCHNSIVIL